jgi:hypothetical protein
MHTRLNAFLIRAPGIGDCGITIGWAFPFAATPSGTEFGTPLALAMFQKLHNSMQLHFTSLHQAAGYRDCGIPAGEAEGCFTS